MRPSAVVLAIFLLDRGMSKSIGETIACMQVPGVKRWGSMVSRRKQCPLGGSEPSRSSRVYRLSRPFMRLRGSPGRIFTNVRLSRAQFVHHFDLRCQLSAHCPSILFLDIAIPYNGLCDVDPHPTLHSKIPSLVERTLLVGPAAARPGLRGGKEARGNIHPHSVHTCCRPRLFLHFQIHSPDLHPTGPDRPGRGHGPAAHFPADAAGS